MEKKINTTLAEIENKINAMVNVCNAQIEKGALLADHLSGFAELEKAYASKSRDIVFDELFSHENPMLAACERLTYPRLKHVVLKDAGDIVGLETTVTQSFFGFSEFCNRGKKVNNAINLSWEPQLALFNKKLCVYRGDKLGIEDVKDDVYLKKTAAALEYGKSLTLKNICKELQPLINAFLGGRTEYIVEESDIEFLLDSYTRMDVRNALTIAVASNTKLQRIIMQVCRRLISKLNYNLNGYKTKAQAEASQAKATAAREAKKATKVKPKTEAKAKATPKKKSVKTVA